RLRRTAAPGRSPGAGGSPRAVRGLTGACALQGARGRTNTYFLNKFGRFDATFPIPRGKIGSRSPIMSVSNNPLMSLLLNPAIAGMIENAAGALVPNQAAAAAAAATGRPVVNTQQGGGAVRPGTTATANAKADAAATKAGTAIGTLIGETVGAQ